MPRFVDTFASCHGNGRAKKQDSKEGEQRSSRRRGRSVGGRSSRELDELIELAVNYSRDFVVPGLKRRAPTEQEAKALRDLDSEIAKLPADASADAIQNHVFEVGKAHYGKENLRAWFQALYETLLGSSQGPRMGSFIALYGIDNSRQLIAEALGQQLAISCT